MGRQIERQISAKWNRSAFEFSIRIISSVRSAALKHEMTLNGLPSPFLSLLLCALHCGSPNISLTLNLLYVRICPIKAKQTTFAPDLFFPLFANKVLRRWTFRSISRRAQGKTESLRVALPLENGIKYICVSLLVSPLASAPICKTQRSREEPLEAMELFRRDARLKWKLFSCINSDGGRKICTGARSGRRALDQWGRRSELMEERCVRRSTFGRADRAAGTSRSKSNNMRPAALCDTWHNSFALRARKATKMRRTHRFTVMNYDEEQTKDAFFHRLFKSDETNWNSRREYFIRSAVHEFGRRTRRRCRHHQQQKIVHIFVSPSGFAILKCEQEQRDQFSFHAKNDSSFIELHSVWLEQHIFIEF